jgi:hypothetical protein
MLQSGQTIQPQGLRQKVAHGGKTRTASGDVVVFVDKLNSNDTHVRIFWTLHKSERYGYRMVKQARIRIQEKQVFAASQRCTLVTRCPKAKVYSVVNGLELKRQIRKCFKACQGIIGGCVVDDDHRRDEVVVVLFNAGNGFCESGTAVPVNEDYVQLKLSVSRHLIFLPGEI